MTRSFGMGILELLLEHHGGFGMGVWTGIRLMPALHIMLKIF